MKNKNYLPKELAQNISSMYIDGKTVTMISLELYISGDRIRRWLKYEGIYSVSARVTAPKVLEEEQENVLIGLMLGDGSLLKGGDAHNARLKIDRQLIDKSYLEWNFSTFSKFISSPISQVNHFDLRFGKTYSVYHFATCSHEVFTNAHNNWYLEKVKIIPNNLKINPLALAVWFLDDGYINRSGKQTFLMGLMTCGFSYSENEKLLKILKETYNITGKILYKNKKKHHYLFFDVPNTGKIISIIDKEIPLNVMSRKTLWRK